jgi:hypothetical protein
MNDGGLYLRKSAARLSIEQTSAVRQSMQPVRAGKIEIQQLNHREYQ